ncbi:ABC transporter ATP-binding protein [Oceanidesulfovibrio marinus]|uniref:ATP-binding cassette domain-containing protein n=1 Tax=Oceanidesulfovibrio marinus TaxID=370038 RepID=A0ABX6NG68_9BACT|nr:oligopeptide/dipeptide ABC transporter ATP-binding protein [Oceanidesulfovibrio marinus]QJT09577.1 ATP-binding cassette domain-containing protein [Oceanidesulfovibrio marinus]
MAAEREPLIEVKDLEVHFTVKGGGLLKRSTKTVRAVDGVSFSIRRNETLGLVGESGSGKTTIGRAILRAINPSAGEVIFHANGSPVRVDKLEGRELRRFRNHMQLIFQDPYGSLNPRMTVRDIIAEPLICHPGGSTGSLNPRMTAGEIIAEPLEAANGNLSNKEINDRVRRIAAKCKLNLEHLRRFPHAFSGGQRQRVCIARALVANPSFVVCDESVAALDVSIQAEIINLLADLQREMRVSYLFIAHDLSVVAQISDRVAVLYVGRLVELAPTEAIFFEPLHPYTHALLSAVPTVDEDVPFEPIALEGEVPDPSDPPPGCRFHTRCPYAVERCAQETPQWREVRPEHFVACHFAGELDLRGKG